VAAFSGPWPAPAKLNLMLRVVGRRPDGYHELQTVFQLLDRSDRLWLRPRGDGRLLRLEGAAGVPPELDLTLRAAELLRGCADCPQGADIRVQKRLPVGGGLGGGSSDAATVLVALNRLWGLGLTTDELARLGLALGADVPVFVHGLAAWGEGVGERLQPLALPEPWFLVLVPACQVATAAVFSSPDLTRNSARITISDFLAGDAVNDCLPVVRAAHPEVAAALDWLGRFASARLTGTGACVFAPFDDETAARDVLAQAPPGLDGFVARGLNRSPLYDPEVPGGAC
jgi:4-diphosphocytidyl-2-C-methyl-D-erythritol kinase